MSSGVMGIMDGNEAGRMFYYDMSEKNTNHQAVQIPIQNPPKIFIPHGFSHYILDGKVYLYVISHTPLKKDFNHSIEVFEFQEKPLGLKWVKTLKDNLFVKPNGLHAIGKDQFFISNDGSAQSEIGTFLEMFFRRPGGSVVYFDGQKSHLLVPSDVTPNGIWVDKAKQILYYTSPFKEKLVVLQLSKDFTKVEKELATIQLLTAPDNLFMDSEGALWTGAHPVLYKLLNMEACMKKGECEKHGTCPPSQVLRIKFSADFKSHEITEPYSDDGNQLPCSSHAIHDGKGNLIIGTIAKNALHCKYTPETILA
ncbi:unnamed protein product, partial [Mesorhabditis spiculigera]